MISTERHNPRVLAVWFKDLDGWDYKSALAASFRVAHPDFVPFGQFIEECIENVRPSLEAKKDWPVYGVNNRGGVFFNHHQQGSEFNSSYKLIKKDWFFHNPTRANVGSMGRVPEVEEDAITSPEYQVWRIKDENWLPEYVEILIQMPFFNKLVQVHRVGAVKERLYAQNLMQIPVPSHAKQFQLSIIDRWQQAQTEIAAAQEKVQLKEREIAVRFLRELELVPSNNKADRRAFAVLWQDFERWSVSYNRATGGMIDLLKGKFSVISMGAVLEMLQYGTSEKANVKGEGVPVIRMNNIVDGDLDFSDMKHVVLPAKANNALLLKKGDILINRTNSKELVGKCGVFQKDGEYVFASYLIRLRVDNSRVLPEYLAYAVNSPLGRQQIDALSRQIIGQANINSQELRSLQIPLPPLEVQKEIMKIVMDGKEDIARIRESSARLMRESKTEIEAMILGSKKLS